jgi:hypothetical protein
MCFDRTQADIKLQPSAPQNSAAIISVSSSWEVSINTRTCGNSILIRVIRARELKFYALAESMSLSAC